MTTVLLDTNVASAFFRGDTTSSVYQFFQPRIQNRILVISFQTHAELLAWAEQNSWGPGRRGLLEEFMDELAILGYKIELSRTWAVIKAHSRRIGQPLNTADAWVAATAVLYKIPLLTTDTDFIGLDIDGLDVISPSP